jgi:two-component system OmpR family response regulator
MAILDIGLKNDPEGGYNLCRELRAMSKTLPIIFLTARDSDIDIVSGLRLGADDYLTKDISLHQLIARIAALFRRTEALRSTPNIQSGMQIGQLSIDADRMHIQWMGEDIITTVTEFWIIHSLAKHPGHVKNRDQLMDDAKLYVDSATITTHIKRIRKKFQQIDSRFDCIESVYGTGYRWLKR